MASVVNCFQITTLVEDSQAMLNNELKKISCELLSDYYFSRRFTGRLINELVALGCELLSDYYFSRRFTGKFLWELQ